VKRSDRTGFSRRQILSSTALALLLATMGKAGAVTIKGPPPWAPFDAIPPDVLEPPNWHFFTVEEATAVEAIVERLIPADNLSISGKDAGCAEFIDRQLAGTWGTFARLYMRGPFAKGTPEQGDQSPLVPQQRYRLGLAALDVYCKSKYQKAFAALPADERDAVLTGLEKSTIELKDFDGKMLFTILLENTMEGFFADPIYGGNRDMVSWKMIGFPGARYDYRDYVGRHNQKLDLPPLGIAGRAEWKERG
jgi:gluconate 2-dehydrogenase gamma chain